MTRSADELRAEQLDELVEFLEVLGAGRYQQRLAHTEGEGRVARLVSGMNRLAEALEQHQANANRAEAELEAKLRELEHTNRDLESFARVASHDLQEPLRMVSSYVALLVEHLDGHLDDSARLYASFALDGAQRMKELIDDLLHYALDRALDEHRPVSLAEACGEALNQLHHAIVEAGAVVEVERLPSVFADPSKVRLLFENLISNAIKYRSSSRAPRVVVSSRLEDDAWVISVADNGIGIDPAFHEHIFEVFTRLHPRDEHSGTGIGLALCRRIATKLGGAIWVTSALDEGSTFHVRLPRTAASAEPDEEPGASRA